MYRNVTMVKTGLVVVILILMMTTVFGQKIKIMPVGDSILRGASSTDWTGLRRYLHVLLTGHGYDVDFVGSQSLGKPTDFDLSHESYSGYFADHDPDTSRNNNIAANIYKWLKKSNPEIVLLHIGTNDIKEGDSPELVVYEVETILDEIDRYETDNSRTVTVVLAQIINRYDVLFNSAESEATSKYNKLLKEVVNFRLLGNNPDRIILVDMENGAGINYNIDPEIPFNDGDMIDMLHPNNSGYKKMALLFYETLEPILAGSSIPSLSLLKPGNGAVDQPQKVVLTWVPEENVSSYRIQISTDTLFESIYLDQKLADTSIVKDDLSLGTTYYWRVIAINDRQVNISYSPIWNFKTSDFTLTAPELIFPENNSINQSTSLELTWNKILGAEQYVFQLANDPGFSNVLLTDSALVDTVKLVENLIIGTQYFWRVIVKGPSNLTASSEIRSFITFMPPPERLKAVSNHSGTVSLTWVDNQENELGFIIERRTSETETFKTIDTVRNDFITYTDTSVSADILYIYRIKTYNQFAESGYSNEDTIKIITSVEDEREKLEFHLAQNYPNPFNPATEINYQVSELSFIELRVYDILGREIAVLVNEEQKPGKYKIEFSGNNLASGIYIYRLNSDTFTDTKKMMLIR